MKKWLLPLIVIIFFAYPGLSLATSNHDSENNGGSSHSSEMPDMSTQEHNQMQTDSSAEHSDQHEESLDSHSNADHPTSGTDTHTSANSEGGEHSHGTAVVETPPNYRVLGTFGAINAFFLLIGAWNKWFRRKVVQL